MHVNQPTLAIQERRLAADRPYHRVIEFLRPGNIVTAHYNMTEHEPLPLFTSPRRDTAHTPARDWYTSARPTFPRSAQTPAPSARAAGLVHRATSQPPLRRSSANRPKAQRWH